MEIKLKNGRVSYLPLFFNKEESDRIFQELYTTLSWKQDDIFLFGKTHKIPRLQAWYGDEKKTYCYSGIEMKPLAWTELLSTIRVKLEKYSGFKFNSVLANLYRDGRDSNGWHADDEKELGENPIIASLSFGQTRRFRMKHKYDNKESLSIDLDHGSLLIMTGETQHFWKHTIAKTKKEVDPRINLTYRFIY